MAYRVVCVSRMTGAGGEPIGELLAGRLGFRYVDDEVIALAAGRAGLDPAVLAAAEHHKGVLARVIDALIAAPVQAKGYLGGEGQRDYYAEDAPPPTALPAESLRRFIQEAIVEIARRGQVVIVAHAASLALAGRPDVLRVHIVASKQTRVSRMWLPNKLVSEEEYAKAIAESDHQRRQYLARFYDVEQESPTHYDLVINTDMLGIEQAVAAITAVATA